VVPSLSPHKSHGSIPEKWLGPMFSHLPLPPGALEPEPVDTSNKHLKRRAECGTTFIILVCPVCSKTWKVAQRCDERICYQCASRRRARLIAKYGPVVARMKWPAFVSLTTPNVPAEELRETMMTLVARFHAMRRRAGWKKRVNGWGLWALEVTYNEKTGTYHPHLHAILETAWLPKEVVTALWAQGWTTIRRVRGTTDGVRELVKYVTKNPKDTPAAALGVIANAFERLRAVQPFGRSPREARSKLDQEGTTGQDQRCSCGAKLCRGFLTYSEEELDRVPDYPPGGPPPDPVENRTSGQAAIEKPRAEPVEAGPVDLWEAAKLGEAERRRARDPWGILGSGDGNA